MKHIKCFKTGVDAGQGEVASHAPELRIKPGRAAVEIPFAVGSFHKAPEWLHYHHS